MTNNLTLLTLLLVASLPACGPADCTVGESRCYDEAVQVCSSAGIWTETQYCESVMAIEGTSWMCCPVPEDDLGEAGHACLPGCGGAE